ncbi:MAG TPA: hypothetical protein VIV13_05660 [Solirubrobacterales bacterium]
MSQLARVTCVQWLGGHRLRLGFEDGASGKVDLSLYRLVNDQPENAHS